MKHSLTGEIKCPPLFFWSTAEHKHTKTHNTKTSEARPRIMAWRSWWQPARRPTIHAHQACHRRHVERNMQMRCCAEPAEYLARARESARLQEIDFVCVQKLCWMCGSLLGGIAANSIARNYPRKCRRKWSSRGVRGLAHIATNVFVSATRSLKIYVPSIGILVYCYYGLETPKSAEKRIPMMMMII